ncbi:hypothetical protein [Paenibacillus amylolyticus]|uniref:hypothetical protein n=1 Tax=Paenibacillus amylolyticus TaxID=1451 RepID=UPI003D9A0397
MWTPSENAKVVGILPDFRFYITSNVSIKEASEKCAKDLIDNDTFSVFTKRIKNVESPIQIIAEQILHMDEIASGTRLPAFEEEKNWAGCYKY